MSQNARDTALRAIATRRRGMSLALTSCVTRRLVLLLSLLGAACREASSEDERDVLVDRTPPKPPCTGCTLDVPSGDDAVPLLVVLHGNRESAEKAASRWREPALARGWAVLSLQCPRDLGCDDDGRWYKWRDDPRWVLAQVAEVARQRQIDPSRVYLAGWSGGATFIGMHAPAWREVAAVVFHGGGQPPLTGRACPNRALPAYFLVGDENPAHPAAKRLRDYWQECGHEVHWDLIDGADHAREDAALDAGKAARILEWLDGRGRAPRVSTR